MDALRKHEMVLYTGIWVAVFALVPLTLGANVIIGRDSSVTLREVVHIWTDILPYFALFIVHNLLLMPLLRRSTPLYLAGAAVVMVLFAAYCLHTGHRPPGMDVMDGVPPRPDWGGEPRHAPPDGLRHVTPEMMRIIMGALVMVACFGAKAYFKALRDERRLGELQTQSLSQQLETLRYQINPHFFMNTLNNIHALVDLDQDKAKESIEEFSKLMRIILYEGNEPTIPLDRELAFIGHFVSLMRLRYPDSVRIDLSFPPTVDGAVIPPLLLASFVENAFKHGISYEAESFVRVSVAVEDGNIIFKCINSRRASQGRVHHGLGLENVRKRLSLMYPGRYTLHIDEQDTLYDILLVLPAREGPLS